MGYLLLMDFKELLQRWIYVLLSAVYRSWDEERNKMTYSRSFSKPGIFKWAILGMMPFYSGCNLQWRYENSQILPWTSTLLMRMHNGCQLFYKYRSLNIFMREKEKKLLTLGMWTRTVQKCSRSTLYKHSGNWKWHQLHRQSCQDLLNRNQQSCPLPHWEFLGDHIRYQTELEESSSSCSILLYELYKEVLQQIIFWYWFYDTLWTVQPEDNSF